jgi:hypothetical protein
LKNVIALHFTGDAVNKAQIARCPPIYASNAEYNAHRIDYINPKAAEIHSIRPLNLKIEKCNCIAFDWDTVNKAQIALCPPYYASYAEYNAHRIDYINQKSAEIRSIRPLTLKIEKCNCIAFDLGQS